MKLSCAPFKAGSKNSGKAWMGKRATSLQREKGLKGGRWNEEEGDESSLGLFLPWLPARGWIGREGSPVQKSFRQWLEKVHFHRHWQRTSFNLTGYWKQTFKFLGESYSLPFFTRSLTPPPPPPSFPHYSLEKEEALNLPLNLSSIMDLPPSPFASVPLQQKILPLLQKWEREREMRLHFPGTFSCRPKNSARSIPSSSSPFSAVFWDRGVGGEAPLHFEVQTSDDQ